MLPLPKELFSYVEPSIVKKLRGFDEQDAKEWLALELTNQVWASDQNWSKIIAEHGNLSESTLLTEVVSKTIKFGAATEGFKKFFLHNNASLDFCSYEEMLEYWA